MVNLWDAILILFIVLVGFLIRCILKVKNKEQIHYVFLVNKILLFIWGIVGLLYDHATTIEQKIKLDMLYYIILIFIPVFILYIGIIFSKTRIKMSLKHLLPFIIPVISAILVITNEYHNLFIIEDAYRSQDIIHGRYFIIHEIYSYLCIIVGLYYLLKFSIANAGFFSKQSIVIAVGTAVPFVVVVLGTQRIINTIIHTEVIAFSFAIICYMLAIFKFDFLNIKPIALQKIMDLISDGFIVIDENFQIIDYNNTVIKAFNNTLAFERKRNFIELVETEQIIDTNQVDIGYIISRAIENRQTLSFEQHIQRKNFDKYFVIEIIPIFTEGNHIGTIILMKDITQHKKDIEVITQTQTQLTERDRLASLGELAGGVAHDINSPLSSIQTIFYMINRMAQKHKNENVTLEECKELLKEIEEHSQNGTNTCKKIAKIINSIRNHTRNLSGETIADFYVADIIEDLKVLLFHQLRQSGCEIILNQQEKTIIKGDAGKLSQVLTNIIVNAIDAYNGKGGPIEVKIRKTNENVLISIKDNAGGIPESFQEGIFKKILTTKGSKGTGLGLYLSYLIITGHFKGEMWFNSKEGEGTEFHILLPSEVRTDL